LGVQTKGLKTIIHRPKLKTKEDKKEKKTPKNNIF
jgi:hypothetical protein